MLRYENREAYCHIKAGSWLFHEILGHSDIQGRKLVAKTSGLLVETMNVWAIHHCEGLFCILFYSKEPVVCWLLGGCYADSPSM